MPLSHTRKLMALAARESLRRLTPHGFRRSGPHLVRQLGSLFHAFNFQASQWGSAGAGSFTVNLIVASPSIYGAWFDHPFPKNPGSAGFPISMRIGFLLPGHFDHRWEVDSQTDSAALADTVAQTLEDHGVPFFAKYETNEGMLNQLRLGVGIGIGGPLSEVVHAIVAHECGLPDECRSALLRARERSRVPEFTARVIELGAKLALPL